MILADTSVWMDHLAKGNTALQAERLFGMGIGYVDLHLLASTRLMPAARLWTRDKRLLNVATQLNLAASASH